MLAGSKTYLLYHGSTKRSQLTRLLEMLGNIEARIESRQLLNDKEDVTGQKGINIGRRIQVTPLSRKEVSIQRRCRR